jgi:hypothetical protein
MHPAMKDTNTTRLLAKIAQPSYQGDDAADRPLAGYDLQLEGER